MVRRSGPRLQRSMGAHLRQAARCAAQQIGRRDDVVLIAKTLSHSLDDARGRFGLEWLVLPFEPAGLTALRRPTDSRNRRPRRPPHSLLPLQRAGPDPAGRTRRSSSSCPTRLVAWTPLDEAPLTGAFQPTFDLRSMSPTGLEALIRWNSSTRGTVQPDEFIPLLEETGLIVDIGRWVLGGACAQGAEWREAGYAVGIAVNVSARQLDADVIVADVQSALTVSRLDPPALTLEITAARSRGGGAQ